MSRPGNNQPHPKRDPAVYRYVRRDRPVSIVDYHFVVPMPRGELPSRVIAWCRENVEFGWLVQFPAMGQPSWKNTVLLFEAEDDLVRFRDHYCYDMKYHKRPHEGDWIDCLGDNE